MQYLTSRNDVHRDLACRNLLVDFNDERGYIVKLADFGLSRSLEKDYYPRHSAHPVRWSAPESFPPKRHVSTRSDRWSFGIVLFEMFEFCRRGNFCLHSSHLSTDPFNELEDREFREMMSKNKEMEMWRHLQIEDCPEGLQAIVNGCLSFKSRERPTFEVIFKELGEIKDRVENSNVWKTEFLHPPQGINEVGEGYT